MNEMWRIVKPMWPAFAMLLAALFVVGLLRLVFAGRRARFPFQRAASLLSAGERAFYDALLRAITGQGLVVFAKVRMLDLFAELPSDTADRWSHLRRVMSKHVDFLLCDARTLAPRLVIELDDRTHEQAHRRERDALVDQILDAAELPILHVPCRSTYDSKEIARQIQTRMSSDMK